VDAAWVPLHLPAVPCARPCRWRSADYYAFWRAPRYRWWKGLLAILLAGFVLPGRSSGILSFIGMEPSTERRLDRGRPPAALPPVGPGFFIANNLSPAACIPVAMLHRLGMCAAAAPLAQRRWTGGVRWRWLFLRHGGDPPAMDPA
jgi:hypothetical protein